MDEKKINHIETSSRASSAANFNSIDIDLRSNFVFIEKSPNFLGKQTKNDLLPTRTEMYNHLFFN